MKSGSVPQNKHKLACVLEGKSVRIIAVSVLAFALGGCLLPPAVSIASFAADGVSFVTTGKSVNDHVLSEVLDQDCALWRIVKSEEICVDYVLEEGDTVMVAEGEAQAEAGAEVAAVPAPASEPTFRTVSMRASPGLDASSLLMRFGGGQDLPARENMAGASTIRPAIGTFDMAEIEPATFEKAGMIPALVSGEFLPIAPKESKIFHGPAIHPAAFSPALPLSIEPVKLAEAEPFVEEVLPEPPQIELVSWVPVREDADVYLILGSYPASDMASMAANTIATGVQLSVLPALVEGSTYFRVVAGPFTMDHARLEKTNMIAAGIDDAWLTRL